MPRLPLFFLFCIVLALVWPLPAQQKHTSLSAIGDAIAAKNFKLAEDLLQQYILQQAKAEKHDSIIAVVSYAGDIGFGLNNDEKYKAYVLDYVTKLKLYRQDPYYHSQLESQAASHFITTGYDQLAYNTYKQALQTANNDNNPSSAWIAQIEYNLGTTAQRLANVNLSGYHHRRSLAMREGDPNTPDEDLYLSYNAMGAIMWYASRYDSASLYFKKALDALAKMPDNEINRYYRPSIIQNNLAGLYSAEGRISEGIEMMKACISNSQKFIASPEKNPKKQGALEGLFQGMDNLAGLYKDIGDYYKAGDLLNYSYQQKKEKLPVGHPGVFISEILLGQHYNDIHEYDKAISFLEPGLEKLKQADGDYLFWEADACYAMALAYENKGNAEWALEYYDRSEKLLEKSYQGSYDNIYLGFLRNAATFHAKNGNLSKAMNMANKSLTYIQEVQGLESLAAFYQFLNLAELSKIAGRYEHAIRFSEQGLSILEKQLVSATNHLDSVKVQVYQPKAILLKLQALYELTKTRDETFLKNISQQLREAHEILKRRRAIIDDEESINILVAENAELTEFSKQIELELYRLNGQLIHLENFVNLHEAGLYNRIRGRLDRVKLIAREGLPASIIEEEKKLRAALPISLKSGGDDSLLMNDYIGASDVWKDFLTKLQRDYPSYYSLRYGSPSLSLQQLQDHLPKQTTAVRYIFLKDSLFALVMDANEKKLVRLDAQNLPDYVSLLLQKNDRSEIPTALLKSLYDKLWRPLETFIKNENAIIIPDGILFALSFEMLTPVNVFNFRELARESLLAKHHISYHYSLYMIGEYPRPVTEDNYIAFVPGFTEEDKQNYLKAVHDSIELDRHYLSLLSQPHTLHVAKKIRNRLGGKTYVNNASTLQSFRERAAGHKIIHIGTHAEFNNLLPERSRLIFSKDPHSTLDSNSLFLSDIYNCSIRSDLTILTACESGKPGFRDGEGMVSMAHAFNYAGSQSILTGLWKIDEKASSFITERFVRHIENHLPAASALRQAKLDYLATADGRTLAPAYWAGLVLIGQTPELDLAPSVNHISWLFISGGLLLAILYFISRKKAGV